ncbi:MAG: peptidoglycan-binding domain-containing protein [Pseudomonadota bacterium]
MNGRPGMRIALNPIAILTFSLAVAGCSTAPLPEVNRLTETAGVITLPDPDTGVCWANDVTPAVIDTVTEQKILEPSQLDADGTVLVPARYVTETRQVIIRDRREQRFEALCETELTPLFVTNLQRALSVRGFYNGPESGELNWRTRRAIRLYQQDQGIDSAILSLETARILGLKAYPRDAL